MAEPAQPELSAGMSPTGIKQEPNNEHDILEGLGLDLDSIMQAATKRPFEEDHSNGDDQSKRVKTETEPAPENTLELDQGAEESLEDGLALLVQNALSNVNDFVFNTTSDPMDIDGITDHPLPPPPPPPSPPSVSFFSDPQKYLRKASRHALGNLALSVLLLFSQSFGDSIKPIQDAESQHAKSFRDLQSSFAQIKQIYSSGPILSADDPDLQDHESRTILDLANLAQFGIWLLQTTPSYFEAHQHFHAVFRGQVSDLGSDALDLYLSLKTQVAIDALASKTPEQSKEQVLEEALINGMEDKLRGLQNGFDLTPADSEFITSVRLRKTSLEGEASTDSAVLREKYKVDDLLRQVSTCVKTRLALMSDLGSRLGHPMRSSEETAVDLLGDTTGDPNLDLDDLSSFFEKTTSGLVQDALAGLTDDTTTATTNPNPNPEPTPAAPETMEPPAAEPTKSPEKETTTTPQTNGKVDILTDYKELEALVAESTNNYVRTTLHGLSPAPYQPTVPPSTTQSILNQIQQQQAQNPYYTSYAQSIPESQPPPPEAGHNLPPNQTLTSAALYDKARQAALSKNSSHTRREGLHSTRRPWTQEEEKALMAGLDMVKGPHWSQILGLFGVQGTISDILKDRTQVQLKDKARNLKLFFLKTNSEMPFYLQAVTGELKTRAPTQAARKEAEERARLNSADEQARIEGIMTLAGGLQNPPPGQGRAAGTPASAVGSGVMTPAQAASAAQAASSQQGQAHNQTAAHSYNPATSSGYPPSTLPQSRPSVMSAAQQSPHQAARTQSQMSMSPQTPRSQHQQLPQQNHSTMHSPAHAAAQARSHTSTPVGQLHHSPPPQHTPTPQPAAQHNPQPHYSPAPHTQLAFPSPPPPANATPSMHSHGHVPVPDTQTQMDQHMHDNAAEAALLQGLQAAVAESL
ncbi:Telomeric DNA-binding factor trf1 [Fusarium austroafricanum]|uniref:Telomeric DNA-binding factor trf1 n=1 Tax=Fusarium austroafricanum TaxID=2364996 RepID=A0A8H4NUT9_9HYPO|nr:Telomeric DNA-binding factor trf1 [Fusarium austroafricanum]